MKKLSRNGLWDMARRFFFGGAGPRDLGCRNISAGVVPGTLAVEIFRRGWSRGPWSSIFVAWAGPVAISDVLWQGPIPWSFDLDIF